MDFSTPWTPSLGGEVCAPCDSYERVKKSAPNSIAHRPWARKTLQEQLSATPEAENALWEGIKALWQLNLTSKESKSKLNWQNLVSAWLHWHRDIYSYLEIAPYDVVTDFAKVVKSNGFPSKMIPSWDPPTPAPHPKPKPDPEPTSHPELLSHPDHVSHAESVSNTDPILQSEPNQVPESEEVPQSTRESHQSNSGEDIDMMEVEPPSAIHSTPKNKQRAPSNDNFSVSMGESQVEQSETGSNMLKRGPDGSPLHHRKISKRIRGLNTVPASEGELDLSYLEVSENLYVKLSVLPNIKQKTCNTCIDEEPGTCRPLWHTSTGTPHICCTTCTLLYRVCSFETTEWGVKAWPLIKPLEPASGPHLKSLKARRRWASLDGKVKVVLLNTEKLEVVWDVEEEGPSGIKQAGMIPEDFNLSPALLPPTKIPEMVPHPPSSIPDYPTFTLHPRAPSPKLDAPPCGLIRDLTAASEQSLSISLQSFRSSEDMINNPNRTPATIRVSASELSYSCEREKGAVMACVNLIKKRIAIAKLIADDLLKEARRLESGGPIHSANQDVMGISENMLCHSDWDNTARNFSRETEDIEDQLICTDQPSAGEESATNTQSP